VNPNCNRCQKPGSLKIELIVDPYAAACFAFVAPLLVCARERNSPISNPFSSWARSSTERFPASRKTPSTIVCFSSG